MQKSFCLQILFLVFLANFIFVVLHFHSDFKSSFQDLLMKDNSFSIHERNIQILAIEIYKFLNGLSPIWITFFIKPSQTVSIFEIIKSFITEIVRQLGMELKLSQIAPKIWSKVPETTKMSSSLESFKSKIRRHNRPFLNRVVQIRFFKLCGWHHSL